MNERVKYSIYLFVLAGIFFIPLLGGVHLFDWDEINFAEISREMLTLHDYLRIYINFQPFWEKPPFFFWCQSLSMFGFGINEFAARLPNAICGIITLIVLFNTGKTLFHTRFGLLWAAAFGGSVLPFLYFKSGIIDPWFNLFIFLGFYYFIIFYWKKDKLDNLSFHKNKWYYLIASGFFIGLGILTKGPVAYLIPLLCMFVYWVIKKFRWYITPLHFILFTLASSVIMLSWYGIETFKNGYWFVPEFNKYQLRLFTTPDAGHGGFPGYHLVVLLFGVFPASIFCARAFFKSEALEFKHQQDFKLWMSILFWVVLILFTIVKSKIVHYSSMCYFPITFLAACTMNQLIEQKISFNKWMKFGLIGIASIYILALFIVPFFGSHIDWIKPFLHNDAFALANLQADVHWNLLHYIPAVFLFVVIVLTLIYFKRFDFKTGFIYLYGGIAMFVMLTLILDINNFENYSQRAAIEFYESKANEDCYIIPYGYHTYAWLFYSRKKQNTNPLADDKQWLIEGPVDKPVYIVTKIQFANELQLKPTLVEIGRKNGFVFFKRRDHPEVEKEFYYYD
jgi:4-amino-4-deoxy-L-arabinose transferase-like glycosyltransferase